MAAMAVTDTMRSPILKSIPASNHRRKLGRRVWPLASAALAIALGPSAPLYSVTGFKDGSSVEFSINTPMGTVTNLGLSGDPAFTVVFAGTITELSGYTFTHPWAWGDGSGETGYPGGASNFEIQTEVRIPPAFDYLSLAGLFALLLR